MNERPDAQTPRRPDANALTPQRPSTGWLATVALALVTAGFSVINPALLIFVPLAFLLIAMPPRRPWLILVGLVLLFASFWGQSGGMLWWFGRGWALILSAWFVVTVALMPRARVLSRALAALAGSTASVALMFLATRRGWQQLDWTVGRELRDGASDILAFWGARAGDQPWIENLTRATSQFVEWQTNAYPALMGLASLAALALAWWLWRRLSVQDPRPLGALRDFRFNDELVWLVIASIVAVVLPLSGGPTRVALNLLVFMGALYALRGVAVMLSLFGSPSVAGALFGGIVFLLLYPIVMATTLMVGLTDTWLDLRARRVTRQDNEKH